MRGVASPRGILCTGLAVSVDATSEQSMVKGAREPAPISLVIPCKAEYVGLCRLVAGVVGARESLDEEVIADMKLVVTEACACFVWRPENDPLGNDPSAGSEFSDVGSLRIDFHIKPDSWEITVRDPDQRRRMSELCRCDPLSEGGLGLTIIKALVDTVEQSDSGSGGSVLRLIKRLPAHPTPSA